MADNELDSSTSWMTLKAHSLVAELQAAQQDVTFSRQVFNISQEERDENFTTGTLAAANCFDGGPAIALSPSAKTVLAVYYIGKGLTGHVGFAHGGSLATIMDECCGKAALFHFDSVKGSNAAGGETKSAAVTASLKVDYVAPVPTDSYVITKATIADEGSSQRKAKVAAQMWSTKNNNDTLVANAESLFIEPKM